MAARIIDRCLTIFEIARCSKNLSFSIVWKYFKFRHVILFIRSVRFILFKKYNNRPMAMAILFRRMQVCFVCVVWQLSCNIWQLTSVVWLSSCAVWQTSSRKNFNDKHNLASISISYLWIRPYRNVWMQHVNIYFGHKQQQTYVCCFCFSQCRSRYVFVF